MTRSEQPDSPLDHESATSPDAQFRAIVGIGASAGGMEAVSELSAALPADTGMAFVLIQHLDPRHPSALAGLLGQRTEMPVVEAAEGTALEPNCIYVIPPNATLRVVHGTLRLTPRPEGGQRHMPIDAFLCSLAEEQKSKAVGVILSGAASDGTLGLTAIKAEGGITFAQDESARFDSMPRSAIAAGVVDFILPPEGIARELAAIAQHPYRAGVPPAGLRQDAPAFRKILRLVRSAVSVDFSHYKPNTLLRRMERRLILRKAGDLDRYLEILQQDQAELRDLCEDLLVNYTEFFRDAAVFEALKQQVYPTILDGREAGEAIRVWVPGCSTGEEAYTIAISLVEHMREAGAEFPVNIFGTDVSQRSIGKARTGLYSEAAISTLSPERVKTFFAKVESGYQVDRVIREKCVFAVHNLLTDPPFSRMDLISCRNVLIYLAPAAQQRILETLSSALRPNGYLLLGSAETPGNVADHFEPLDTQHRIHVKKPPPEGSGFEMPAHLATFPVFRQHEKSAVPAPKTEEAGPGSPLERQVDRLLLARYTPPAVVIDQNFRIVEFRGEVGRYLFPEPGQAGLDLLRMVREDLALHLRAAVEEARQKSMGIRLEGLRAPDAGQQGLTLAVTPVSIAGAVRYFLIAFEDTREVHAGPSEPAPPAEEGAARDDRSGPQRRIAQLENELTSTRQYLQSIIEELRSANEEAQSSNEELQSSNEELQTAKEELEASNEELYTLNTEMDSRNAELRQLNDDLSNLLTSLHTPILMLDNNLRIRRFTQASEKLLKLIPGDVGRPVSDLKPRINVPDLEEMIRQVVDTLSPREREVQDQEGRWYSLRVRPYRTSDNRIDGAVLQLLNVHDLKTTLEDVRRARDYASAIVQTVREPLVVLDSELRIETANRAFFDVLRTSMEESLGKSIFGACGRQLDLPGLHDLLDRAARSGSAVEDVEIESDFARAGHKVMLLNARPIQGDGRTGLILLAFEDITERKRAAEARYRRLFEAAKDGILIVDAETGEIRDANPYLETLFGYRREELVGRTVWEVQPLQTVNDVASVLERVRGREKAHFADLLMRTRSGRAVHGEVVANEYTEGDRRVILFNIRDITERRDFERQLQHTQKLESLGVLAGGIAHDFNNLLTGIMGSASIALMETAEYAPIRRYLREILGAGQQAANLTRQMLAYAGKGRFVTERINLSQLIREIEPLIRTSIPKMVAIDLDLAPDLPAIEADPGQIQQLVMNLIINGAEAIGETDAGSVVVLTELRELNAEEIRREYPHDELAPGKFVAIDVRDTGAGMDEATMARIFDPFFTTKFQGRGLGLAAVAGIVRAQRGAIRVRSTPGRGSSFEVLFPAVPDTQPGRSTRDRLQAAGPGGTVLFADDEETVRSVGKSALERNGWRVLLAEDGAQAVRLFQENQESVTLVILDMAMPVMGGEEAFDRIKAIRAGVPVIVSTGYGESEAVRRFADRDVAGFLQKPYSVTQLFEVIATVFGRL